MSKSKNLFIVLALSASMFLVAVYGSTKDKEFLSKMIDGFGMVSPSIWQSIGISLLLIVLITLFTYFRYKIVKQKNINAVKTASRRYNRLSYLNKKYTFHNDIKNLAYKKYVDSKKAFDNYNFTQDIEKRITFDPELLKNLEKAIDNIQRWSCYLEDIQTLPSFTDIEDAGKMKYSRFCKIEENLIKAETLSPPVGKFSVFIDLYYISPKGRNTYHKQKRYSSEELMQHIIDLKNKQEVQKRFEETGAYQRKLLTNSMRYDVLKRDQYKCVICGRTVQDGIKLHVDHILPISKGGKTVMSNLRTLCNECNLGKSDKWEPTGLN